MTETFEPRINTDEHGLKHGDLTDHAIGVFYNVYNELGHGFLEAVYEEAMAVALVEAGLKVQRQVPVPVWFRGRVIGEYKADLLVEGLVLLELKSVKRIEPVHEAQLLHYLRATEIEVGLVMNFGARPEFRRLILDNETKKTRGNQCKSVAKS
jgi:GxxExxY protein